jgi:transposase
MHIKVVGLDIAKQVFQVHAADEEGRSAAQVRLRRSQVLDYFRTLPSCLIGMEACATVHHWARELMALGHEVRTHRNAGGHRTGLALGEWILRKLQCPLQG